jgi:putative transcriptional regulator
VPIKRIPAGKALGLRFLQSIREMRAGQAARTTLVKPYEIVLARQSFGLSQAQFAQALSISTRTPQEWEQGRRKPSGAAQAQALLPITKRHPKVVREAPV